MPIPSPRLFPGAVNYSTTLSRPGADWTLVTVVGEIDLASIGRFRDDLAESVSTTDRTVLDLSRVDFLGCAGVRALDLVRHLPPGFALVAVGSTVPRALSVTGLDAKIPVRGTVGEALAAC